MVYEIQPPSDAFDLTVAWATIVQCNSVTIAHLVSFRLLDGELKTI